MDFWRRGNNIWPGDHLKSESTALLLFKSCTHPTGAILFTEALSYENVNKPTSVANRRRIKYKFKDTHAHTCTCLQRPRRRMDGSLTWPYLTITSNNLILTSCLICIVLGPCPQFALYSDHIVLRLRCTQTDTQTLWDVLQFPTRIRSGTARRIEEWIMPRYCYAYRRCPISPTILGSRQH